MEETKNELKDVLPNTLHELLELALKDYDLISKDENYVINMSDWHFFTWKNKCAVCLAGCVMANQLNIRLQENAYPTALCKAGRISYGDYKKLMALDHLREGMIYDAFVTATMKRFPDEPKGIKYFTVEPHFKNPIQWRSDMDSLLKLLKEHNL